MRKLLGVLVLSLFTALAVPSLAMATHSNGQGPDKDFVNGAAKGPVPTPCGSPLAHFHTNGQSDVPVTGALATGHFFTDIDFTTLPAGNCLGFQSAEFSGDVTCVNAYPGPPGETNSAVWGGVIQDVILQPGDVPGIPGLLFPGMGVLSRHVDNGSPGAGNDEAVGFTVPSPPVNCPTTNFTTSPIVQGNLLVHDGV